MVTIDAQFNGPDHSGNGGYVCGMLGAEFGTDAPVTATLHIPPPLNTALTWEQSHDTERQPVVRLETHGGALVGTATAGSFAREALPFPTIHDIAEGLETYKGFHSHPFGRCFTCGPEREEGDGLRLFTGPIAAGEVAGPWFAHPNFAEDGVITTPVAWAALDCPGGWAADFTQQPMVLGRMTAQILQPITAGVTYHARGCLEDRQGRKFLTSTALYTEAGVLAGRAEQVWIEIDIENFS